jgi:hypothetical protein
VGDGLQVDHPVVPSDTINMVDVHLITINWCEESFPHQVMVKLRNLGRRLIGQVDAHFVTYVTHVVGSIKELPIGCVPNEPGF